MSGGSYNYIYSRLLEECENRMYDAEMNDLINDLCEVLHGLEWWQSCDSSEEKYRATVEKFKAKWFKEDRTRLKGYIDETIEILKDLWQYEHSKYSEKDIRKALDIAIKALEQEPCEDCISRAQALSDYADWYGCGYSYNTFYEHLKNMPSIQPKTDVLDKIRAEIEQAYCKVENDYDKGRNYGLHIAKQIIDNYKLESEE